MLNNKNKMRLILLMIVVLVIVVLSMSIANRNSTTVSHDNASQDNSSSTTSSQQSIEGSIPDIRGNTIANQWQWSERQSSQDPSANSTNEESSPFTEQSVYDALQAVKVDENGNIILDHDALISLDEALERIHNRLGSESLLKLQDIIRDALPGKTGEQTAQIVEDYHRFLGAQEEFNQMHRGAISTVQSLDSLDNAQALYRDLQNLRDIHLGTQNTASLFHESDANAEFMFDSMRLGLEQNLTAEEKANRRREIQQRLQQQLAQEPN